MSGKPKPKARPKGSSPMGAKRGPSSSLVRPPGSKLPPKKGSVSSTAPPHTDTTTAGGPSGEMRHARARVGVYVRLRPPIELGPGGAPLRGGKEGEGAGKPKMAIASDKKSIVYKADHSVQVFTFDAVFPEDTSQESLYDTVVRDLVDEALMGYNVSLLAYGPTTTGKTYTMFGEDVRNNKTQGIIPRVCKQLFAFIVQGDQSTRFTVQVSVIEIFREEIHDLLAPEKGSLALKEHPTMGVYVENMTEKTVRSEEDMIKHVERGSKERAVGTRDITARSSRSHCIAIIAIQQVRPGGFTKTGRIYLGDLAGADRMLQEDKEYEEDETNRSLLCLKRVILALTETDHPHIPFKDSILTRILQESLSGNSRTVLLATGIKHDAFLAETLSTLSFATKVKSVRTEPQAIEHKQQIARREGEEKPSMKKRGSSKGAVVEEGGAVGPMSTAEGVHLSYAIPFQEGVITIHTKTKEGKEKKKGGEDVKIYYFRGPSSPTKKLIDNGNGTYTLRYTLSMRGTYQLHITVHGAPIQGSPFKIRCDDAYTAVEQTVVSGSGICDVTAGETTLFYISARDQCGGERFTGGDTLAAKIEGPEALDVTLEDFENGQYTALYNPTVSGHFYVGVTMAEVDVPGSPFDVFVRPGKTHPSNCVARGVGLTQLVSGDEASVHLQAKDVYGNHQIMGGDFVEIVSLGPGNFEHFVNDNNDGTYDIVFNGPAVKGIYTLSVMVNQEHISDSPFTVTCLPGATHAPSCIATGDGLTQATAGKEAYFLIEAFDAFGNKRGLSGDEFQVHMAVQGGEGALAASISDNGDGTHAVTYAPTVSGRYTTRVTLRGIPIAESPFDTDVLPAKTDASKSVASIVHEPVAGQSTLFMKIQARDRFGNNEQVGGDKFAIQVMGPSEVETKVKDRRNGTFDVYVTAPQVGEYRVLAQIDGKDVGVGPMSVNVLPSMTQGSMAEVEPFWEVNGIAGKPVYFLLQARDAYGNRRTDGGDTWDIRLDGPSLVSGTVLDNKDGSYEGSYTVSIAGVYQVAIRCEGLPIAGSPFEVEVEPGSTVASKCTAVGQGIEGKAVAGVSSSFLIQAKDQFGNNRSQGGDEYLACLWRNKTRVLDCAIRDKEDGTYVVSFQHVVAGDFIIAVTLSDDSQIAGAPFPLTIVSAETSARNSTAEGRGLKGGIAGETMTFMIQAHDEFDNKREVGGDLFEVSIRGPATVSATVLDGQDGTYKVTYRPTITGEYTIDIRMGRVPIKKSPFSMEVVSDATYGPNCTCNLLSTPTAGDDFVFSIQAHDQFNNKRCKGGDQFLIQLTGTTSAVGTIRDLDDGSYEGTLRTTVAGKYTTSVLWGGEPIQNGELAIDVRPNITHGPACTIESFWLEPTVAGEERIFRLQARDSYGNARDHGGDLFDVTLKGPVGIDGNALDNRDGTYTLSYVVTQTGNYTVHIQYDGFEVNQSPCRIKVEASITTAERSYVIGDGVGESVAGALTTFSVQACDAFGNPRLIGGDHFSAYLSGTADLRAEALDSRDGTYTFTFTAFKAGEYSLFVELDGRSIRGSPFSIRVRPGIAFAPNCRAYGPGLTSAFAGEVSSFSIQAVDMQGNKKTFGGEKFEVELTHEDESKLDAPLQAEVVDQRDGTHQVSYTAKVSGGYSMRVTLGSNPIQGSPFLPTVAPSATDPKKCITYGSGLAKAKAGEEQTFTIQAVDACGNLRTTGGDVFSVSFTGPEKFSIAPVDNEDGTYVAVYMTKKDGAYQVYIAMDGTPVSKSPFDVSSASADVDPASSTIAMPVQAVAGELSFLEVQGRDIFKNQVKRGGEQVSVNLSGVETSKLPSLKLTDQKNGTYRASFKTTIAGQYTADATMNGIALDNSPFAFAINPQRLYVPNCDVTAFGRDVCMAGVPVTFTITARDQFGNAHWSGGESITVDLRGPVSIMGDVEDPQDGTYRGIFTPTMMGQYKVLVKCAGKHFPGSPFGITCEAGPVCAANCIASGAGVAGTAVAGKEMTFKIQSKDLCDNNVSLGGEEFVIQVSGDATITGKMTDHGDGTYLCSYMSTKSGNCKLNVQLARDNGHIQGSPFVLVIHAEETDPAHCTASGRGLEAASAFFPSNFVVHTMDRYGNPRGVGGDRLTVDLPSQWRTPANTTDKKDGSYLVEYRPENVGRQSIGVKINGTSIVGAPFTVSVRELKGVLTKVGGGCWPHTPQRFFHLREDRLLKYPNEASVGGGDKGYILLATATLTDRSSKGDPWFEFRGEWTGGKQKHWILRPSDPAEKESWVSTLQAAITQAKQKTL